MEKMEAGSSQSHAVTGQEGHKLKAERSQLDMRGLFCEVTEPWDRLPEEVVGSPSLQTLKISGGHPVPHGRKV